MDPPLRLVPRAPREGERRRIANARHAFHAHRRDPLRRCPARAPHPYCRAMRHGLAARMLLGLLIGLVLGSAAHLMFAEAPALAGFVKYVTEPAGRIFLRLLFMLVIPLIVSALSLGVSGL